MQTDKHGQWPEGWETCTLFLIPSGPLVYSPLKNAMEYVPTDILKLSIITVFYSQKNNKKTINTHMCLWYFNYDEVRIMSCFCFHYSVSLCFSIGSLSSGDWNSVGHHPWSGIASFDALLWVPHQRFREPIHVQFRFDPVDFLEIPRFAIVEPSLIVSGFINFTNFTGGVVNCSKDFVLLPPVPELRQNSGAWSDGTGGVLGRRRLHCAGESLRLQLCGHCSWRDTGRDDTNICIPSVGRKTG